MSNNINFTIPAGIIAAIITGLTATAPALEWTRPNGVDFNTVGLYHVSDADVAPESLLDAADGLPTSHSLVIGFPISGAGATASGDTAGAVFGPHSLRLDGDQRIETLDTFSDGPVTGDNTTDLWMKWENGTTSSSFTAGFGGACKLWIARDAANPANDKFGVRDGHGTYVPLPGFTNWTDITSTAPMGQWHHVASIVKSTGTYFNGEEGHASFNPGSHQHFWFNNVYVGTVDISDQVTHTSTRPQIRSFGGSGTLVDEFTLRAGDLSNNLNNLAPFADGRGGEPSSATQWEMYE